MEFLNETTYVDQAESVIKSLNDKIDDKNAKNQKSYLDLITTTKIRSILSMAADIYNNAVQCNGNTLNDEIVARIEYLRVKMIYECGRDTDRNKPVKIFIKDKAQLLDYIRMVGNDKKRFILFYRYLEALVAFHRFYGGKDN